jgi:Na+/melibiose symporter-like transporter
MTMAQRIAYLAGASALGAYSAFNNYSIGLWLLSGFTGSLVIISLLGNSKSVEGAIISPLVGYLSDRTWLGLLGRRRPFILVGGVTSAVLMALTPTIADLPLLVGFGIPETTSRLVLVISAIVLFTLTFNLADDLHKALRADIVRDAELNILSSLAVVVELGTQVLLLAFAWQVWNEGVPDWAFVFVGALVALGVLATVLGVREPSPEVWHEQVAETRLEEGSKLPTMAFFRQYPGAGVFCLVNLAYWAGVNAVLPLLVIYVKTILGTTDGEAQIMPGLLLLSTMLFAIPAGWLANRVGKKRVLALGYAIMATGAVIGLLITTREQGAFLFFLAGIGNSVIVLAVPIMADLVPRHHMGVGTGLLAASGSIAAPAASLVAGMLSEVYGPRVIFAVMAVSVAIAIALLPLVRPPGNLAVEDESMLEPEALLAVGESSSATLKPEQRD